VTTASDEAGLRALIGRIEATFGVDLDGWMACFARPMVVVTPIGTLTLADDAAVAERFGPIFDALVERGFASTTADEVTSHVLDADLALVDASFTRRRADGSELERVAALYVCRRVDDGWIVATLIGHPPETRALT
jgi:hypothetical protein